jgi:NADPH-dependent 7-cyano-7-deazaguanine reductase QueF
MLETVAEMNKQLSAEQKKLQQQLESYAKQNIDHEEKMRTVLQRLEVVEKQKSGKGSFCC